MSMAQKNAAATSTASSGLADAAKAWWLFLITGIAWFIISLVVLRFNDRSITTVGVILGVVFIVGALNEFVMLGADEGGWEILHGILGGLFVLAGIWAFAQPEEAFWALASVLGFLLLMMGTFEIIAAVETKDVNPLWWLGLLAGILFLVLAFWTSQQLVVAKGELLLFYVGLMAMFRGIGQIVFAFGLRSARDA
jgi:uncharacterized membrane protein HdeD (DUF308 family)